MKASLSNVTRLPNTHRGCVEGSPEALTGRTDSIHRRIQNGASRKKRQFSKDWIRLFGDSLLNQSWVYPKLGEQYTRYILCSRNVKVLASGIMSRSCAWRPGSLQRPIDHVWPGLGWPWRHHWGSSIFTWWQQWWLLCKADVEKISSILQKVHTEAPHSLHADMITAHLQCMLKPQHWQLLLWVLNVSDEMLKLAKSAKYGVIAMHIIFHPL